MVETDFHKFIEILWDAMIGRVPVSTSFWWNLRCDLARLLTALWRGARGILEDRVPIENSPVHNAVCDARESARHAGQAVRDFATASCPVETAGSEDLRWFLTILLPVLLAVLLCLDKEMTPEKPEEPPVEPYRIEKGIDDLHKCWMLRSDMLGAVVSDKALVYADRDVSSPVRHTLKFGDRPDLVETSPGWVFVKTGGTEGFVQRKDLVLFRKGRKLIALTYDDGPDAWGTKRLLQVLKRTKTRVTFFQLGYRINSDTAPLVKQAAKMGCEIGNHSWDHAYLPGLKKKKIASQLSRTDAKIKKLTGKKPALVRPPYGALSRRVKEVAGRPLILWSVDTEDWYYRRTTRLIRYVKKHKRDGAVILMHDIHPSTVRAAEPIIRDLKASGYQLVTVTEMTAIRGEKLGPGTVYIGK